MLAAEYGYTGIYEGKSTPLFLSNLCSVASCSTVNIISAGTLHDLPMYLLKHFAYCPAYSRRWD